MDGRVTDGSLRDAGFGAPSGRERGELRQGHRPRVAGLTVDEALACNDCCGCANLYVCSDGGWSPWGECSDAGTIMPSDGPEVQHAFRNGSHSLNLQPAPRRICAVIDHFGRKGAREAHVGLLGRLPALAQVADAARRHEVLPGVVAAARAGQDVVDVQLAQRGRLPQYWHWCASRNIRLRRVRRTVTRGVRS